METKLLPRTRLLTFCEFWKFPCSLEHTVSFTVRRRRFAGKLIKKR
jgi:hypothetical protein